jgi:hypothetical protein
MIGSPSAAIRRVSIMLTLGEAAMSLFRTHKRSPLIGPNLANRIHSPYPIGKGR